MAKGKRSKAAEAENNSTDGDENVGVAIETDPPARAETVPPVSPGLRMNVDDVVSAYSPEELLDAMRRSGVVNEDTFIDPEEYASRQIEIDDESAKLDRLFAQIDGLTPEDRVKSSIVLRREEPPYRNGVLTKGYCGTMHPPFSLEEIKREYGGGKYKIIATLAGENAGKFKNFEHTCLVEIAGEPKVGTLESDQKDGLQLSPVMNAEITELRNDMRRMAEPKPTAMDKLLETVLAAAIPQLVDRYLNPPKAEVVAPPPPPPTLEQQLAGIVNVQKIIKQLAPEPPAAAASDGPDADDESMAAEISRGIKHVNDIITNFDSLRDKMAAKKMPKGTPDTPEARQAHKEQTEAVMNAIINKGVERLWGHLMVTDRRTTTIAKDMRTFLKQESGNHFDLVIAHCTLEHVTDWLNQSATTDEMRKRIESTRGKKKIKEVVEFLQSGDVE